MKRIRNTGDFLRTSSAAFSSLIVVPVLHFGVREGPVPKEHKRIPVLVYDSVFAFVVEWRGDTLKFP